MSDPVLHCSFSVHKAGVRMGGQDGNLTPGQGSKAELKNDAIQVKQN